MFDLRLWSRAPSASVQLKITVKYCENFCFSNFAKLVSTFFFRCTKIHSEWKFKSNKEALVKTNSLSDFWWTFLEKNMFLRGSSQIECWTLSHFKKTSGALGQRCIEKTLKNKSINQLKEYSIVLLWVDSKTL